VTAVGQHDAGKRPCENSNNTYLETSTSWMIRSEIVAAPNEKMFKMFVGIQDLLEGEVGDVSCRNNRSES
jgi:hypothetical protein